jgi:UDP-N-acetylmuramoyl-tripeptide--D-alanyl-D-alanine ligase
MTDRTAGWVAAACGGRLVSGEPDAPGPRRAVVDSRAAEPGDLFVGLRGSRVDGADFAAAALERGAWGVVVERARADAVDGGDKPLIAVEDPLAALAALARAWRRALAARVVAITGSTGKTSTKDIVTAMLAPHLRVHATRENLNTEIGLPLTILEAARGTQCLVLELAMRGAGQIAELTRICEPDVGLIVNVGPVHLELLGTLERVAAAKAELIAGLRPGAACVVPAREPLLARHLRDDLAVTTFGAGGDVRLVSFDGRTATIDARGDRIEIALPYSEPYNLLNTVAAAAATRALGVEPPAALEVRFSSLRGAVVELEGGVTVVNDCYNANPMSMRAALEHLAASPAARRVAVLGRMAELGPDEARFHRELGDLADRLGIDVLITVGEAALAIAEAFDGERYAAATPEEARLLLDEIALPGDRVLVKGSRSAGLERVLDPVGAEA